MSAVIHGHDQQISLLVYYLQNYGELCSGKRPQRTGTKGNAELALETKYYTADVKIHPLVFGSEDQVAAEGFILLPSTDTIDLQGALYSAAHKAVEEDVNLRLLVALSDELHTHTPEAIRGYEEWALDNGFEFIEIGRDNITEGFAEREKSGLPRLMEALESNMWSTMRKRKSASSNSSSSTGQSVPVPVPVSAAGSELQSQSEGAGAGTVADAQKGIDNPPSAALGEAGETTGKAAGTTQSNHDTGAPEPSKQAQETAEETARTAAAATAGTERGPFEEDLADAEENEIIDKYSSFINEVKEFRQLSTSGGLSDQARRDQAAAMAMKLSQMFGLDSDSDSDA